MQPEVIDDAAPATAQHPLAVRVIDHQQDAQRLRDLGQGGQRRDVAVHAEHAIGDDQAAAIPRRRRDLLAQIVRIGVAKAHDLRARQAAAIDDAGVVQLVGKDHVAFAHQRGNGRQVRGEAALESDRGLGAFELGQPSFQLQVQVHRPGDGAHRGRPDAIAVHRLFGGFDQPGMVRQAEVVVR